jgi:hypothetical protein
MEGKENHDIRLQSPVKGYHSGKRNNKKFLAFRPMSVKFMTGALTSLKRYRGESS